MDKLQQLKRLTDSGIVAVIRRPQASWIMPVAKALTEGGVGALEITADTPGVYGMISQIKAALSGKVLVGAGTVLDARTAKNAIDAGSDFIFSPNMDEETMEVTLRHGRISIPGVMTPTEIVKAWQAGADLLKIFPGRALGPDYLKELRGPLGHIRMMPTGGVDLSNVGAFIRSGAVAVGLGGALVDQRAAAEGRYEALTQTARQFTAAIQQARGRELSQ